MESVVPIRVWRDDCAVDLDMAKSASLTGIGSSRMVKAPRGGVSIGYYVI